jgi:hypothetical protein
LWTWLIPFGELAARAERGRESFQVQVGILDLEVLSVASELSDLLGPQFHHGYSGIDNNPDLRVVISAMTGTHGGLGTEDRREDFCCLGGPDGVLEEMTSKVRLMGGGGVA